MTPSFLRFTRTVTLLATCLAPITALQSQTPAPGQPGYQPVELVRPEIEPFRVSQLVNKPVRGAGNEQFSHITDFLVDPQSGRVHFVVVDAGSNTSRLIPMSAIQPGSGPAGLIVALDRAQWDQVGTLTPEQLQRQVTVDASHQQRLQQQFRLSAGEEPLSGLIRTSQLHGREVRAASDRLGTVEDVVIDFHNRIAAPLVKTAARSGAAEQRVLVHFPRLQVSPDAGSPIVASISRGDLSGLGSGQLTPTGPVAGANAQNQPAQTVAIAVQHALESNGVVPRGSVQVYPETRVVLRGVVENEQKRADVERAAQQAAPGMRIENQLMVRPQ